MLQQLMKQQKNIEQANLKKKLSTASMDSHVLHQPQ